MRALILLLIGCALSSSIWAEDKKVAAPKKGQEVKEPVCAGDVFDKAVTEQVEKQLDRLRSKSVANLMKEILDKEKLLQQREEELNKREEIITNNAKELDAKIVSFEERQKGILGCIRENEKNVQDRVDQMVNIFSNMKPVKAAEILSVQEADIAVKILSGMDAVKVSKIFNLMDKEISARLQKQYMDMKK